MQIYSRSLSVKICISQKLHSIEMTNKQNAIFNLQWVSQKSLLLHCRKVDLFSMCKMIKAKCLDCVVLIRIIMKTVLTL